MSTITQLLLRGMNHWNEADKLAVLGAEFESRSRLDLARMFLERSIELDPNGTPDAYLSLAFANFRDVEGKDEAGEAALADGIEATDDFYVKCWFYAITPSEEIAQHFRNGLSYTDIPAEQLELAGAMQWRGLSEEALKLFRTAIAQIPAGTYVKSLTTYISGMRWFKAQGMDIDIEGEVLPRVEDLIRLKPDVYLHWALRIQVLEVIRDDERIIDACKALLAKFPDEETTMLSLAIAYERKGDLVRAIQWLNRAIGTKHSFARARIRLAAIYEKQGNVDLAEEVIREIPLAYPQFEWGGVELALFLFRTGKKEEGIATLRSKLDKLKPHHRAQLEKNAIGAAMMSQINNQEPLDVLLM